MSSVLKFALVLLLAIIFAVVARFMYMNSQAKQNAPEPDIHILVAAADLPAGLLLRESDLDWQLSPRNKAPKGAIVQDTSQANVLGSLLRHKVQAGTVLLAGDMIRPDAPGFLAAALKPGLRAVSVPINDVSGNAGLIQPGDYVDMILTQNLSSGGDFGRNDNQVVSETVVSNVRVIAVGSSFTRDNDKSNNDRARTVTIEVKPRVAEAVTVASQLGSLSLALRSFATTDRDTAIADEADGASVLAWANRQSDENNQSPVWGSDISQARGAILHSAPVESAPSEPQEPIIQNIPKPQRSITIMRGDQTQEIIVNGQ